MNKPQFGDMFYSDYFQCECVLVRYDDDDNWWFYPEGYYSKSVIKAKARPQDIQWFIRTN